jgi:hypothetical protein
MKIVELNLAAKTYRGPWEFPDDSILIDVTDTLENAIARGFIPEPPAKNVPEEVPAWALMAVVDARGKKAALEAAVNALPNGTGVKFRWLFARGDMFPRNGATVNLLGAAIGLTPAQIDDLFIEAQTMAESV